VGVNEAQAIYGIDAGEAQFAKLEALVHLMQSVRIDILQSLVDYPLPFGPGQSLGQELEILAHGDSVVHWRTNQPGVGDQHATSRLVKLLVRAEVILPDFWRQKISRQRLKKENTRVIQQMKVGLLGRHNLSIHDLMAVHWSRVEGSSASPETTMDLVYSGEIEVQFEKLGQMIEGFADSFDAAAQPVEHDREGVHHAYGDIGNGSIRSRGRRRRLRWGWLEASGKRARQLLISSVSQAARIGGKTYLFQPAATGLFLGGCHQEQRGETQNTTRKESRITMLL
jgi:hypothetical protein